MKHNNPMVSGYSCALNRYPCEQAYQYEFHGVWRLCYPALGRPVSISKVARLVLSILGKEESLKTIPSYYTPSARLCN